MGWSRYPCGESVTGRPAMSDDPIAGDPVLLATWTRYVGILIALLAISVGASSTDTIDIGSLVTP